MRKNKYISVLIISFIGVSLYSQDNDTTCITLKERYINDNITLVNKLANKTLKMNVGFILEVYSPRKMLEDSSYRITAFDYFFFDLKNIPQIDKINSIEEILEDKNAHLCHLLLLHEWINFLHFLKAPKDVERLKICKSKKINDDYEITLYDIVVIVYYIENMTIEEYCEKYPCYHSECNHLDFEEKYLNERRDIMIIEMIEAQ